MEVGGANVEDVVEKVSSLVVDVVVGFPLDVQPWWRH